jgi:hypothetical protein
LDVIYEQNLDEVVEYFRQPQLSEEEIVESSWKLAEILTSSIEIKQDLDGIFGMIVSAQLNIVDLESAISWVNKLESVGYELHDISKLLKSIVEKKKGKQIDDITDTFVLREIAGLHKKLGALKKAKAILQRAY